MHKYPLQNHSVSRKCLIRGKEKAMNRYVVNGMIILVIIKVF